MTREGREYGRRRRESSDEETDRIVRETIDEVRKEIESRESSESNEQPEREYDPEKCVREAIEEVRQEEAERQRLREERELAEMEKEEQLEASREARKETADKDDFEELEKRILEGFDEYGIDPEEVKERWRKKFEEEVQDEFGEKSGKETEGEREDDESAGQEKAVEGHCYYDDGTGQMYEVKMDSKESSGTEMESCDEVQEVQEETPSKSEQQENNEPKRGSGEIESEDMKPSQGIENSVGEQSKKRKGPEQEESSKVETEEVKQAKERTTKESADESLEEQSVEVKESAPEIHPTPEKRGNQGEEHGEVSISTPEIETKDQSSEPDEHIEREVTQETEEKLEDESESREEEIWSDYEIENGSLEDDAWKRYLREVLNQLPEEERERFREYVREQVQTMEDFEEIARRHGLDELLEDEDVMVEVRNYLKLRRALENEPDTDIERLAEELGIDAEQAREWSSGQSEPYSLKKLLNLEAFHLWDEVIRSYREQNYPDSREELEKILETNSELRIDRFFPLEQNDAIAWVEIMAMRRRGEIRRRIRNGREVYSREQIMELNKKYAISAPEIISWLRGEQVPSWIWKIGSKKLKKQNIERASFDTGGLIGSRLVFEQVLSRNQNIRLDKRFDTWYRDVMIYFEIEASAAKGEVNLERFAQEYGISVWKLRVLRKKRPYLLNRLEHDELRRLYVETKGNPPEIRIDSMEDMMKLLEVHQDLKQDNYDSCETYFKVVKSRARGMTYTELSKKFKMSRSNIHFWLNGYAPKPIPELREMEEERLIQNWAEEQVLKLRIAVDNEKEQKRLLRKIVLPDNGKIDSLEALKNAVRSLAMQLDLSSERVLYAEVDYDNKEQFLVQRNSLEQLAKKQLKSETHLAYVDKRLYIWVPNDYPFRLINLYSDLYFYFPNTEGYARFLEEVKTVLDRTQNQKLEGTQRYLENLVSQMFTSEQRVVLRDEKGRGRYRLKGKQLHLLLDILGIELSELEGRISRITERTGYGGIRDPRFPTGERLASILARLYATIGCDGSIRENGLVVYWEEHLNRIKLVSDNLKELGNIQLKPNRSKKKNYYVCIFPSIIGKLMNQMGLPVGNKTLHNPRLDRIFLEQMNFETSRAFAADTLPEDGTVRAGRISCTHSVMLRSGMKNNRYGAILLVGNSEIKLIKKYGKREGDSWRLPIGKLRKLRQSTDSKEAQTASKLYKTVHENPSNQIKDEKQIIESLGVEIVDSPLSIYYHGKSRNVIVAWRWTTAGANAAMKLAIIAPPNDVKKRGILRKWLLENPEETEKVYRELNSQGVELSRWWNEE